jgi:hypothetical protein
MSFCEREEKRREEKRRERERERDNQIKKEMHV